MNNWVDVNKYLPAEFEMDIEPYTVSVLVATLGGTQHIAYYDFILKQWMLEINSSLIEDICLPVSHWQYLPELPLD